MTEKKAASDTAITEAPVVDVPGSDVSIMDACIAHAKEVKVTQLQQIKNNGYDFAPEFMDMTLQLYLFGVMWRLAEKMGGADDARELAFAALGELLLQERMPKQKVIKRIEFLKKMSRAEEDHNALAVAIGYESEPGDNSLAEVLDHYIDDTQVSGAFWRLYDRGRKIILYGGLSIAFFVIWFVTLFMPGNTTIAILAAGLIAAALFVIPVFLIGIFIYRTKIKKIKRAS